MKQIEQRSVGEREDQRLHGWEERSAVSVPSGITESANIAFVSEEIPAFNCVPAALALCKRCAGGRSHGPLISRACCEWMGKNTHSFPPQCRAALLIKAYPAAWIMHSFLQNLALKYSRRSSGDIKPWRADICCLLYVQREKPPIKTQSESGVCAALLVHHYWQ